MAHASQDSRVIRRVAKRVTACVLVLFILKYHRLSCLHDAALSVIVNSGRRVSFDLEVFVRSNAVTATPLVGSLHLSGKINRPGNNSTDVRTDTLCPQVPPGLRGRISPSDDLSNPPSANAIFKDNPRLLDGGHFAPSECRARYKVAIIVPFRAREPQLHALLAHMHPIWQRQQLDYTVYTVTQVDGGLFNRAKLINIGVSEARKDWEYDCYVFHDTDLLVEDDRCLYWCHQGNPRQLAKHVDVFSYEELSYPLECNPVAYSFRKVNGFGGVSMLTKKQFNNVNGYSNLYWGWGGEDDDMFLRLWKRGYAVENPYGDRCSFRMLKHNHEKKNAANPARQALLFHSMSRMSDEGFSTLRYNLVSVQTNPLYTNITVDIGQPSKRMEEFMSRNFNWFTTCIAKMPWIV